jgi:ADP-ribosylglycohydrolase
MTVPVSGVNIKKFEGVILGAALGDALGWPHEDRARRSSSSPEKELSLQHWTKRSGGRFQPHEELIDAGSYSDDTQLIIAVARSRLRSSGWWHYLARIELPFWTLYNRGAGGASLRAARLLQRGILPWESNVVDRTKYFAAGGNGTAMRVAPHSLLGFSDNGFDRIAKNVLADSVLTHGHPTALVGGLAYAYALWVALRKKGTLEYGQLLDEVRASSDHWSQIPSLEDYWPSWTDAAKTKEYRNLWNKSVAELRGHLDVASEGLVTGALDFDEEVLGRIGCFDKKISGAGTVAAAAAIFLASKYAVSPMEGVARAALAKGADTDTIASMTGAIAGAINGIDWFLPSVRKIQDNRFLTELALKLSMGSQRESAVEPLSPPDLDALLYSLSKGEKEVVLPIGSHAKVLGDGGVTAKSERVFVSSWKLEDENRQTFFIKEFKRQTSTRAISRSEQERLDLEPLAISRGRLAGISLFARSLTESRHFYSRLLGLSITRDTDKLVALGDNLVLRQNSNVTSVGEGSIVYIDVDDIRSCWQNLQHLPYAKVSAIEKKSQRSSFTCRDPDGRTVEVFQR